MESCDPRNTEASRSISVCRSAHHDGWRLGIGQKNPYIIDLGVTVQGYSPLVLGGPGCKSRCCWTSKSRHQVV